MDLTVSIGALTLTNPLIAASGCFGYGVEYADIVDLATLGGVAVKGLFLAEREGHVPPRIVETPSGMLNAIGLQGIGVHRFVREKLPELRDRRAVVGEAMAHDEVGDGLHAGGLHVGGRHGVLLDLEAEFGQQLGRALGMRRVVAGWRVGGDADEVLQEADFVGEVVSDPGVEQCHAVSSSRATTLC